MQDLLVIGGGISGMVAAWEAATTFAGSVRVTLLEASDRLGGKIAALTIGGVGGRPAREVDAGPDAFVARRPEAIELCRELDMSSELVEPGVEGAYVWARSRLRRLPKGLALGVPTAMGPLAQSGILSFAGVARACTGVLVPPVRCGEDAAVGALVERSLGRQVAQRLTDPLVGGINAGPTSSMSAQATFPDLLSAARRWGGVARNLRQPRGKTGSKAGSGAIFLAPRGGVWTMADRLAEQLSAHEVAIRTACPASGIDRHGKKWSVTVTNGEVLEADALVLAVPPQPAAKLLAPISSLLGNLLGAIPSSSVVVCTMAFESRAVPRALDATGFLVPAEQGLVMTGCTWMSAKWPHLARPGEVLMRASAGRFEDDRAIEMDDEQLTRRFLAELRAIMGLRADPEELSLARWPSAFPQYLVGHPGRVEKMQAEVVRLGRLGLAGAAYRGVGIPACISTGREAAHLALGDTDLPR